MEEIKENPCDSCIVEDELTGKKGEECSIKIECINYANSKKKEDDSKVIEDNQFEKHPSHGDRKVFSGYKCCNEDKCKSWNDTKGAIEESGTRNYEDLNSVNHCILTKNCKLFSLDKPSELEEICFEEVKSYKKNKDDEELLSEEDFKHTFENSKTCVKFKNINIMKKCEYTEMCKFVCKDPENNEICSNAKTCYLYTEVQYKNNIQKEVFKMEKADTRAYSPERRSLEVAECFPKYIVIKIDDGSTHGQKQFFSDSLDWMRSGCPGGEFVLTGPAGTGKTTIASKVRDFSLKKLGIHLQALSFTGKAVSVLRDKGFNGPKTLHSYLYKPRIMRDPKTGRDKVHWELLPRDELADMVLLVDEYSMIAPDLLRDLRSYGIPIMFTGDNEQLPPVKGDDNGISRKTNVLLTEVVRQALDNPIIRFATDIRLGHRVPNYMFEMDNLHMKHRNDPSIPNLMLNYNQILCGTNKTRTSLNDSIRKMKNYKGVIPLEGEKLICLRNNKELSIYNGQIFHMKERLKQHDTDFDFFATLKGEDDFIFEAQIYKKPFSEYDFKINDYRGSKTDPERVVMDFAYAITVHKSQGSEFDSVILMDEGPGGWMDEDTYRRWKYTGVTRAKKKLLYVIP